MSKNPFLSKAYRESTLNIGALKYGYNSPPPEYVSNEQLSALIYNNRFQSDKDIIDSVLGKQDLQGQTVSEEVALGEDKQYRRYRVTKDSKGTILQRSLVNSIDAVRLKEAIGEPTKGQVEVKELFTKLRPLLDTNTDQLRTDISKGFWDNILGNSNLYKLGKLAKNVPSIPGMEVAQTGLNVATNALSQLSESRDKAYFNKISFKEDGIYYDNTKLPLTPRQADLVSRALTAKATFKPDGFGELLLNTALTFAIDSPLYIVGGAASGAVLGDLLPGIVTATDLPGKMVNYLASNLGMLAIAQSPSTIEHTTEGGASAFIEDMKNLGEFTVLASVFGIVGETIGTGISKLLQAPKNLTMNEAVSFLKRNPKMVNTLTGGFTSAMLGYQVGGETKEEKLATALTFATMHFASAAASEAYLRGEQKQVMVENDNFNILKDRVKQGIPLLDAIKETNTKAPNYFLREGKNLYQIDNNKFITTGQVEKTNDTPIILNKNVANDYKYITETLPFAVKTLKSVFEDKARIKAMNSLYDNTFSKIKNPYNKETQLDDYQAYEFNKSLTASYLANMIYTEKLTKALKTNELPKDLKFDEFVNEITKTFDIAPRVFRSHIESNIVDYIKNPKGFEEGNFKFLPEQYKKLFKIGLDNGKRSFQDYATELEVQQALKGVITKSSIPQVEEVIKGTKPKLEAKPVEEKKPYEQPPEVIDVKPPEVKANELVDLQGRPLESTKGAGLTEAERKAYNRERETIQVKEPVDKYDLTKIKTVADMNEALDAVDKPIELIKRLEEPIAKKVEPSPEKVLPTNFELEAKPIREEIAKIRDKLFAEGKTEKEINAVAFEDTNSKLNKLYNKLMELDAKRHSATLDTKEPEGEKAVKLKDGTVISSPDYKSHLEFAQSLSKENIDKVIETGVVNPETGAFKNTMTVTPEQYREALTRIQENQKVNKSLGNIADKAGEKIIGTEETKIKPFGIDKDLIKDYAIVGAHLFERGLRTFADWSKRMISTFGQSIKKFLGGLWKNAMMYVRGEKAFLNPNILGAAGFGEGGKEFNERRKNLTPGQRSPEELKALREKFNKPENVKNELEQNANLPINEQKPLSTAQTQKTGNEIPIKQNITLDRTKTSIKTKEPPISNKDKRILKTAKGLLERYKPKRIKGRITGTTLDADTYAKLSNIRRISETNRNDADITLDNLRTELLKIEKARQGSEEGITSKEALESQDAIEELIYRYSSFADLKNLRGQSLLDAKEGIKEIVKDGRSIRQKMEDIRKAKRDVKREQFKKDIGFEILKTATARQLGKDKVKENWLDKLKNFDVYNLNLENILRKVSTKSNDYADRQWRDLKEAQRLEESGRVKWQTIADNAYADIYGVDVKKSRDARFKNTERIEDTGIFVTENGKQVELQMSKEEAIAKWIQSKAQRTQTAFENMGYTEETFKQLDNFLTDADRTWGKWVLDFYKEYHSGINEVYRRVMYTNLPSFKEFSPIQREVDKATGSTLDEFVGASNPFATLFNNHLKTVVKSKAELRYEGITETLNKYIGEMERFKAFVEPIRELRGIVGDTEIRTVIRQNYGNKTLSVLDVLVDNAARGGIERGKIYPMVDKLRNNVNLAQLGFNVTLFPKQLTSFGAYLTEVPVKDFVKGIAEFMAAPIKNARFLYDNSRMLQTRYRQGIDRDIYDLQKSLAKNKIPGLQTVGKNLLAILKAGDFAAIAFGGYPTFKYYESKFIKEGISPKEAQLKAITEFEILTERLQQSGAVIDQPYLMSTGSFGRLFTMYASQPNQYYQVASNAFRDLRRGKGLASANVKRFIITHFALPMLFQFVADGFTINNKRQLRAGLLGSLNGLLIVGNLAEAGVSALLNDFHFDPSSIPVLGVAENLDRTFSKMGKIIDSGEITKDDITTTLDNLAKSIGKLGGIPYEPVKRLIQSGQRFDEYGVSSKTLLSIGMSTPALTGGVNIKKLSAETKISEGVLLDNIDAMRIAKRRYESLKKKKNNSPDSYTAYIYARNEYRRLVNKLRTEK